MTSISEKFKILKKAKSVFENCDHSITFGNANTLSLFPGEVANYSDERLKYNVETIEDPLSTVCKLRGVRYNRNDINNDKKHIGLIAQEVEKVLPEVISEDNNGIKSVAYGNMISLLIEAIKEQQTRIDMLEEKLNADNT